MKKKLISTPADDSIMIPRFLAALIQLHLILTGTSQLDCRELACDLILLQSAVIAVEENRNPPVVRPQLIVIYSRMPSDTNGQTLGQRINFYDDLATLWQNKPCLVEAI